MTNGQIKVQSRAADELNVAEEVSKLEEVGERLIKQALAKGASQVEVGVSKDLGLSVQVRNQQVETLEYNRDNSFGLTVYFGQKKGIATTSDLTPEGLDLAVDAACNIAKYTQPDPCSGLADKSLMASQSIDLKLDIPMGITAEKAQALAKECELAGTSEEKVSQSEGASFSSHRNIRFYANSHGFSAAIPSTRHSLSCVLIAEDEQGMQRDYWYSVARDASLLESAESIGKKAATRVAARLGGKKLSTQKAPVLMIPEVARGLVGNLCSAIQGSSIYRKSSFLIDSLNQQVFPKFVQIQEKPHIVGGLASAWFDNEGVATKEQFIVENGDLQTFLLGSYSARRLNMQPTGHAGGVHNLHLATMDIEFNEMIKKMDKGLIVTDVMGHGINLVTGDYSRGASGFWVENGEIQHFVQEITIASNLKTMFRDLVAIGNDIDYRSSHLTGSWLLAEMTIAGQNG
ncbi:metalloprotease PmbA [Aliikangiella sp. IMCC44359]|uniref:metalloprotease PmbA n=1 Tax=Aliikangiella sp. IMCC44359 TaxID=3459125 RepID=UPI00403B10B1